MRRFFLLPFVLLFAVHVPRAGAQPSSLGDTIRIVRIDTSAFPFVRVHVRVFCNGLQYNGLSMVDIEVEDGEIIKNFTLSCPSTTVPISAALVLDRSSSVAGTSMYRIQEGAWRFVELMQKHAAGIDEAAIISFASDVHVDQSMTTDQALLFDAIEQLYAWGNTAMFDAVMFGIYEAAEHASNPIRAVVLLSDGEDNVSSTDLSDVIDYARREGIPVYTLCLVYHADPAAVAVMRTLAQATGGMFFPLTHPDDIIPAFNAIASILSGGANDCIVQYRVDCPDGSVRTVKVTAKACGKTVTATARYKSPVDPNMPAVVVHFDSAEVFENGDLFIPVRISAVGSEAEITHLAFGISRIDSIEYVESLTAGHFAESFTLAAWRGGDTLHFRLDGGKTLTGTDTLMILHFRVRTFAKDSVLAFLVYSLEKNTVQCMLLKLDLQRFSVRKRPRLSAACGDEIDVKWNRAEARYEPAEAILSATIVNTGTIRARNTRAWISLPYGVQLVSGPDTVYLHNNQLEPNASETVLFQVRFIPTDTAKTYDICITVQPDSGLPVVCCTRVSLEQARPALRCTLSLPAEIHWSDSTGAYEPPEFPVTFTVRNLGPLTAREVEVWMDTPSGFSPAPDPPLRTMLVPSRLAAAETGSVTWMLTPIERTGADEIPIYARAASGGDTALCMGKVFVGAAPVRAAVICADPRILVFDEEKGTVDPQAFIASVRIRNISGVDMAQARGIITLPPFLTLAPGETYIKNFPGGAVLHPGDSATLTWAVMTAGKPIDGAQICMDILASNYRGGRCCIPLVVRTNESAPLLRCSLAGPDTVHYRNGRYDPDPFALSLRVENIGTSPARTVYAALLQGADLSIDSSDHALKMIADSLAASASAVAQFRLRATDRPLSRFDTIRVSVYAANGGAVMCEWVVWIEAVRRPRLEVTCAAPEELRFSDSLNTYVPSPFAFSLTARNVGNAPADSVVAEILLPPDMTLASGEQAAKLLSPSMLDPGQSGVAAWAAVAVPRPSPRSDTVRAIVRIGGKTAGVEGCRAGMFIPARRAATLDIRCMPESPLTVSGDSYVPDPFAVRLVVRNGGDADAYDLTAEIVSYGRLARITGDSTVKIRPILKSHGGEAEFTWYFTARPTAVQDSAVVCIRVAARFLGESICCTTVHLPPLGSPGFTVSCSAPDTVCFDTTRGSYPNPVTVSATVTNTGAVAIDSIRASIILPAQLQLAGGETPDRFIAHLGTGGVENMSWRVDILRDTVTTPVFRLIRVQVFAGEYRSCETGILVFPPPPGKDTAVVSVRCTSPDTIRYVNERI
ncbi:MAG: VWA domain-containing protein, partial [Bacteroidota bacterium]|nr:VWA domain-containing protein [Bacteroidota bacterium]